MGARHADELLGWSNFAERLVFYLDSNQVCLHRDDCTTTFSVPPSNLSQPTNVIVVCHRLSEFLENNAYYDGDEELIPKCVGASLLESLLREHVSRHIKAFPVID